LSLAAPYQRANLATVLAVVAQLREQGFDISERAVTEGLAQARWPGRFQFVARERIILDVSHNAQGVNTLGDALGFYFGGCPLVWMVSLRKNREPALLKNLLTRFAKDNQHVICVHGDPETVYHTPETLAAIARAGVTATCTVETAPGAQEGLARMQALLKETPNAVGVITGSLYTAGKLLQRLS
jgi:dihydrofolate synthase/folylpolyglutamate synthase